MSEIIEGKEYKPYDFSTIKRLPLILAVILAIVMCYMCMPFLLAIWLLGGRVDLKYFIKTVTYMIK